MLNNRQKQYLKALAHARKPVIIIGDKGLTEAVLSESDSALTHHELIKIRINAAGREQRETLIRQLGAALHADRVQRVGHIVTLFRRNPDAPRIRLP